MPKPIQVTDNNLNVQKMQIFQPWRVNKEGQYIVAAYSTWTKIRCLDYHGEQTIHIPTDLNDPFEGQLMNSYGQLLFWHEEWISGGIRIKGKVYGWEYEKLTDCEGVPPFTHYSRVYIENNFKSSAHKFKPLTLDIVREYFQRFVEKTANLNWIYTPIKSKELILC